MSPQPHSGTKSMENSHRAAGLQPTLEAQRKFCSQQKKGAAAGQGSSSARVKTSKRAVSVVCRGPLACVTPKLPLTFRVTTSNDLIKKIPHRQAQRPAIYLVSGPTKFRTKISHPSHQSSSWVLPTTLSHPKLESPNLYAAVQILI